MPRKIGQAVTSSEAYNRPFPTRFRILVDKAKAKEGKSQQKIAEELGFSNRQTIGYYYNGSQSPSLETLAKIAEYFNVTSDYLLGLTDAPTTDKEKRQASDYTGLSQNSMGNLRYIVDRCINDDAKNLIDRFLCSGEFTNIVEYSLNMIDASNKERKLRALWEREPPKGGLSMERAKRSAQLDAVTHERMLRAYMATQELQKFLSRIYEKGLENTENDLDWEEIALEYEVLDDYGDIIPSTDPIEDYLLSEEEQ